MSQLTHLLSVCPPEDNYLLPEQLRDIDELNQYFPSDVEVDKDGYKYRHVFYIVTSGNMW